MTDLLTLGDFPLMSLLPAKTADRLAGAATRLRFTDGRRIHGRGDQSRGLSIVVSGAVRFIRHYESGQALTVSVLGPGHSFGEATVFGEAGRAYDAEAVGDTAIDQISKPALERLMAAEPTLAHALLTATTRRLYAALSFLDDLRSLSLEARTAKLLLGMLASAQEPDRIQCRQSDLAFTLGVSRVSIGKALSVLKDEGLIALGYGEIVIGDAAALQTWIEGRAP